MNNNVTLIMLEEGDLSKKKTEHFFFLKKKALSLINSHHLHYWRIQFDKKLSCLYCENTNLVLVIKFTKHSRSFTETVTRFQKNQVNIQNSKNTICYIFICIRVMIDMLLCVKKINPLKRTKGPNFCYRRNQISKKATILLWIIKFLKDLYNNYLL